jgi:hypothetical protein
MNAIRIELATEFKGGTVVLLAMDREGLDKVRLALVQARTRVRQQSTLAYAGKTLTIFIEDGATTIDLQDGAVLWRLSMAKLNEIVEKLDTLRAWTGPCHDYVDIAAPADTLVLSKDEYI